MESIRKALDFWGYYPFYHQEDNFYNSKYPHSSFHDTFMLLCFQQQRLLEADDSLLKMNPTSVGVAEPYSLEDLKGMTDNFSTECLIKKTMHGKVFRGSIQDCEVTIKTWDFFYPCQPCYVDHPSRFCNELELLTDEKPHSSLVKIRGFCFKHILAVVYDEKPTKFLSDELHFAGKDFGWHERMKVVTQFASLFAWLHERQFAFGCVDPSTIMIDKDFNIKVFDFGFLTHISGEQDTHYRVCWDDAPEIAEGIRTIKSDVYTFGLLIVELIFQKEKLSKPRHRKELKDDGRRLKLDRSFLQVDEEQVSCMRELVTECLEQDANVRPAMKDVFATLSHLGQGSDSD